MPRRRGQRGVVLEDLELERLQRLAGLEAELLRERSSAFLIGVQGLSMAAGAVARDHQLAEEPLAQRVLPDELLERGRDLRVPAQGELGVDPLFLRAQPELLQVRYLGLRERLVREVGERCAPKES